MLLALSSVGFMSTIKVERPLEGRKRQMSHDATSAVTFYKNSDSDLRIWLLCSVLVTILLEHLRGLLTEKYAVSYVTVMVFSDRFVVRTCRDFVMRSSLKNSKKDPDGRERHREAASPARRVRSFKRMFDAEDMTIWRWSFIFCSDFKLFESHLNVFFFFCASKGNSALQLPHGPTFDWGVGGRALNAQVPGRVSLVGEVPHLQVADGEPDDGGLVQLARDGTRQRQHLG